MRGNAVWLAVLTVDAFAAVTALGGGIALLVGLEGDRFPLTWLHGTPFSSYVVPGVILAAVVGGSAAVAAAAVLRTSDLGVPASIVAGAVMSGWIIGEVLLLKQPTAPTWTEIFFLAVGVTMAGLGLALGRIQRIRQISSRAGPLHGS